VIPLPEAGELTVQLRRRENQARAARADTRDWTPYVVVTPAGRTEPLRKRRAVLAMVSALHQAGVPASQLAEVLTRSKFLAVDGTLGGEELAEALVTTHPGQSNRLGRWFLEAPIHEGDRTWLLSKMWGRTTEAVLERLVALAPGPGFSFEPGPES
jgi:hypothetical protein